MLGTEIKMNPQHSIYFAFTICKLESALNAAGAGGEKGKGNYQMIKPSKVGFLIVCPSREGREEEEGKVCVHCN